MQIDFETFLSIVDHILDAKKPVLIRGKHGIGKSEVVYQTAKRRGLPVVERRASQMTEGDLVGLPSLGDNRTTWNPPDWFKVACEKGVLLFLDEVDRATLEVRQGIFELTDSRKLNGHHLHPDTLIVAAVNGGEAGAQYQVGEMDPAELDRWTTFDLNPTVEDWLTWGKQDNNINPILLDFITQNRDHLEHKQDFEPNKKYPSRRSWKRFNDVMESADLWGDFTHKARLLALGFVGHEAAVAFSDFFQKYDRQVTPDDIIKHGKHKLVEGYEIVDHVALIEKMGTMGVLKDELSKKELNNLGKYLMMCPSEAVMVLWKLLGQGPTSNTLNLHNVEVGGKKVGNYFAEIIGSKSKEESK